MKTLFSSIFKTQMLSFELTASAARIFAKLIKFCFLYLFGSRNVWIETFSTYKLLTNLP